MRAQVSFHVEVSDHKTAVKLKDQIHKFLSSSVEAGTLLGENPFCEGHVTGTVIQLSCVPNRPLSKGPKA